jgi:predicted ATPase/DNA-binding winged helix-turn-helix (wHTH) protein
MPDTHILMFEPFRVDLRDERLWRGEDAIHLTNKAFAVLRYLLEHPAQLVPKEALFDAVWSDTFVSDAVLTVCIRELRRALGDDARASQFIETVRGRGYRFLAPVTVADRSPAVRQVVSPAPPTPGAFSLTPPSSALRPVPLVGREAELTQVHQWLATASEGVRQVGFVVGEVGIGKTTLVDAFVAQVESEVALWIGHGQCIDQYGAGEAYLPVLEALGRLCRGPEGHHLLALLRQQAPSWLVQMPALLSEAERETMERQESGATQARMLRELAEAVETLTVERPLVLVLEDLQWSDASTLAWLAYVARRRETARLLVLGTYRPVEAIVHDLPLRTLTQELRGHGQCEELLLDYLSEAAVTAYLAGRRPSHELPAGLARMLHQRTDGNPLFLVTLVDTLVRQGVLEEGPAGWHLPGGLEAVAVGVPESLRQLIERHLEQVSPEDQTILEAASVVGAEFSAAAVAAGVERAAEAVEAHCAALARRGQFVQARGTAAWPDGMVAARYGFIHALYQEVLYDRIPAGQRVRVHQQIGGRLEVGYGVQAREIAAELAAHFVRGGDAPRTVQYLRYAGENAWQRSAPQEAITHLTKGLEVLQTLPATPAHLEHELMLLTALGPTLITTLGAATPDVERVYARARVLCGQVGDTPQLFPVLWGLWRFYHNRGELQAARQLGEQMLTLAQRQPDPTLLLVAYQALGGTLYHQGESALARTHLEQDLALPDPEQHRALAIRYGVAPRVLGLGYAAQALWVLGYPDQAMRRSHEALTQARQLSHPTSLGQALYQHTLLHQRRREAYVVHEQAECFITLATEKGFAMREAMGLVFRGWALVAQGHQEEGLAQMRQGLTGVLARGAAVFRPPYLTMLAEALGTMGHIDEGLQALTEARAALDEIGPHYSEAETYRLRGELVLRQAGARHKAQGKTVQEAEACFHQALAIARRQQAKSWELRATTSLARLWQSQGKRQDAYDLLAPVYEWFTEGFDTADLQDAKALLDELA